MDAFARASRFRAPGIRARLRQMPEVLDRVEAVTGSLLAACAWFRAEPLPGFAGVTPNRHVRERRAEHVHACLGRIIAGGCA